MSDAELGKAIRDACKTAETKGFAGVPVQGWGDGELLKKFVAFLQLILPIIIPLIIKNEPVAPPG